jgi:hypothetical protein
VGRAYRALAATIDDVLRLIVIIDLVINVSLGLTIWATRGAATNMVGLPSPLPFYANLLAIFLVGTGLAYVPAIRFPQTQRFYLWVMGVGVKLAAASQFIGLWLLGVVPAMVLLGGVVEASLGLLMALALLTGAKRAAAGR